MKIRRNFSSWEDLANKALAYFQDNKDWIIENTSEEYFEQLISQNLTKIIKNFYREMAIKAGIPMAVLSDDEIQQKVDDLLEKEFKTAPAWQQFDLYFPSDNNENTNNFLFEKANWIDVDEAIDEFGASSEIINSIFDKYGLFVPMFVKPQIWEKVIQEYRQSQENEESDDIEFLPSKKDQEALKDKWGLDDWEKKNYEYLLEIKDGFLLFRKPRIQTSFPFGYGMNGLSTEEDTEAAYKMEKRAKNDTEYFINSNLRENELKPYKEYYNYQPLILFSPYYNKQRYALEYGPLDQGKKVTLKELDVINQVIATQRENFLKRLQTYLKKYGLSKIDTWTYLRD